MDQPSASIPLLTVELLRRIHQGDGDAVAQLFDRYAPRVRGLVAVRMGWSLVDLHDVDDVVQETLLKAFQRLETFEWRNEGSLICWLGSIVASRLQDALRAARAEKRGGGERVVRRADLGVSTLASIAQADPAPRASQVLADAELDPALERAMLSLGSPLREIVYCRLVLEMDFIAIAEELQLRNVDSTRARFHQALQQLRERLGH